MRFDLNEVQAFLALGKHLSFSKAALKLGVPKSYISRKVAELETRLKVRLVNRTTRSVALTEEGSRYYEVCTTAFENIQEVERSFEETIAVPHGHLRLTCPVEFGPIISRLIAGDFLQKNPTLTIEVLATNTVLDLSKENVDIAIRPSQLATPDMIAKRLGILDWHLYASPKWLRDNQAVCKNPETIKEADLIAFNPRGEAKRTWQLRLQKKDRQVNIDYHPRFIAGNISVMLEAVLAGCGIASLPDFLVQQHVGDRELTCLLPDWYNRREEIFAVYSSRRHLPAKTRALLDYIEKSGLFKK